MSAVIADECPSPLWLPPTDVSLEVGMRSERRVGRSGASVREAIRPGEPSTGGRRSAQPMRRGRLSMAGALGLGRVGDDRVSALRRGLCLGQAGGGC